MGCGAAEATGLGCVYFVVIKPRVLSANRVDFRLFFCFINCQMLHPPPPRTAADVLTSGAVSDSEVSRPRVFVKQTK